MRAGFAWSCLLVAIAAPNTYAQAVMTGFVRDSAGRTLADVEVSIDASRSKTRTDSLGRYLLTAPVGEHLVFFRLTGYQDLKEAVRLSDPDTLLLDVRLVRAAAEDTVRAPRTVSRVPAALLPLTASLDLTTYLATGEITGPGVGRRHAVVRMRVHVRGPVFQDREQSG